MDFSVTKNKSNSEQLWGNSKDMSQKKNDIFQIPRKFISKHIKLCLSSQHTDELFWKRPCFGKTQAWHDETAG
jgi:hypothetical protein